ncbi:MAG TPA: HNH endonuclease signature motif containing protein [Acidimicrobiales bacterium]
MPAEHCEIDHIHPHAQGGPTTQDNARLLCPHHHRHHSDDLTAARPP